MSRVDARWAGPAAVALALAVVGGVRAGDLLSRSDADTAADVESRVLDRTLDLFEEKFRADPEDPVAAARLVDGYRRRFRTEADLSDLRRAEEVARAILPVAPDRAAALARLSRVRLDLHDFRESLRIARRAVASDSADPSARAALFDAALALGDHPAAEAGLTDLPEGSYARALREARWMAEEGEIQAALRAQRRTCQRLQEAGGAAATRAWCLTQLADMTRQAGDPEATRAWLQRALEAWPGYRAAVEGLAELAHVEGRLEEAGQLFRRIVADAHPDLYLRLAEVELARGDTAAAQALELRFLSAAGDPGREPLFGRPLALYLAARGTDRRALEPVAGDLARALALARSDVERRPTAEAHEVLAWIRLLGGEPEEALAASDRARVLAPGPDPSSDYHRARILEALDRDRPAGELLRAARGAPYQLAPHVLWDLRRPVEDVAG